MIEQYLTLNFPAFNQHTAFPWGNFDGLDLNLTSNIDGKVPLASKSLVRCNAEAPLDLTFNIDGKVPLASKSLVRCNAEAPLDRTCENDMMVSLCGFNQMSGPPYYITMTD